ncbi:chemotaxis protein CheW [Sutcliffiella sp. NC1]|nr:MULTISPECIES: chemotaxis protein CheW [Sutcliffiella]MED4015319.1 chemotaxis protein CheW [Sutcliffiella cohnii]WBL17610.1 chemotaxis protein CheW [Sutcliffiella sp. NC1]
MAQVGEKLIAFELNNEQYVIPVNQVKSIEKVLPITRVPNALPYVKGVVNLRGVITPIIDFRTRFNIEEKEYTNTTRILITIFDDIEVGFIVDAANDVIDILEENIEHPSSVVGSVDLEYIKGVINFNNSLYVYLDLEQILKKDEIQN